MSEAHRFVLAEYHRGVGVPEGEGADVEAAQRPYWGAVLPVGGLATGAVAAFAAAANRARAALGLRPQEHELRADAIAGAFADERLLRIDGEPFRGFAELSGFFPARDGWVRTHANYPHHRERLLSALDVAGDVDRAGFAARIVEMPAAEVERLAAAEGAVAVQVRTESDWATSEPGIAAASGPLVDSAVAADRGPHACRPSDAIGAVRPLAGLRVLDFTRVLSGPVATRSLALLGADVLRVDPPWLPEIEPQHIATGQGKRTTLLDVRADADTVRALLSAADVVVTGYRPGALADAGLDPHAVRPGVIHGRVSAWGESGPWQGRRGFDSIVQAACGIGLIEGDAAGAPGALPVQALDHATGYLLAAGILDAVATRAVDGHGRDVRVSLARTASALLAATPRTPGHPRAELPGPDATVTHDGVVTARPALADYPDYPWPARPHGSDQPEWDASR